MPTPYTNPWNESTPSGSVLANQIHEYIRAASLNIRERLVDILGTTFPNDTVTQVTASTLVLKGTASPKIIPGATSLIFRNNADSQDNLVIANTGAVTVPNGDFGIGGAVAVNRYYYVSTNAGQDRGYVIRTGALQRWVMAANSVAEGGANAGSNFEIRASDDAGSSLGAALTITRATRIVTIATGLVVTSGGVTVTAGGITISAGGLTVVDANILISGGTATRVIEIQATAGNNRVIKFSTGTSQRWQINGANNASESGANAGSNFTIDRYTDAGAFVENAININRASGQVIIAQNLTVSAGGVTITGASTFNDTITVTGGAAERDINISANAGQVRALIFKTGVNSRWGLLTNSTAEGGANAGSDLQIFRYNDAGAFIDSPLSITRSSGLITITTALTSSGGITISAGGINVTGTTVFNNDIRRTSGAADSQIIIDTNAGFSRNILFRTGTNNRWRIGTNNVAESGANAGSDFVFQNFDDAGATLGTPVTITRSNGQVTFANNVIVSGSFGCSNDINANSGFKVNSLAPSGQYLRGNGTLFIASAIQEADLPVLPSASAWRNTNLNLAAATATAVGFDNENFNSGTIHDNVTNNSRFTVPTTGKYRIVAHVSFVGIAQNVQVMIRKNGVATNLARTETNVTSTSVEGVEVNCTLSLTAGDYVEVYAQSDVGASPCVFSGQDRTYMEVVKTSN